MSCDHPSSSGAHQHCDLVFLAVPAGTAMDMAAPLLEAGVKVVDLSADSASMTPGYTSAGTRTSITARSFCAGPSTACRNSTPRTSPRPTSRPTWAISHLGDSWPVRGISKRPSSKPGTLWWIPVDYTEPWATVPPCSASRTTRLRPPSCPEIGRKFPADFGGSTPVLQLASTVPMNRVRLQGSASSERRAAASACSPG